jgi:uncharacterized membrane protein YccC
VVQLLPDALVQAALLVLCGAVFFGTRHTRYALASAAVTTALLLGFHQLGMSQGVVLARLVDTAAGCLIAAAASWLLLPHWQARQWPVLAAQALTTQAAYLREILAQYQTGKRDHLAYRIARRNAHNADAALSNSYLAMLKEPRHARGNGELIGSVLRLSHTQLNYLSAMGAQRAWGVLRPIEGVTQEAAQALQASLVQLAQELEGKERRGMGGSAEAVPDEARRTKDHETPDVSATASALASCRVAAQLDLVDKIFPELQSKARQLIPR